MLPTKPRIYFHRGMWWCGMADKYGFSWYYCGHSPQEAWLSYLRKQQP